MLDSILSNIRSLTSQRPGILKRVQRIRKAVNHSDDRELVVEVLEEAASI